MSGVGEGQEDGDHSRRGHASRHPRSPVAEALDQRRPQDLQREGHLEEPEAADGPEGGAVDAEVDGQDFPEEADRTAFDGVEERDDEELLA